MPTTKCPYHCICEAKNRTSGVCLLPKMQETCRFYIERRLAALEQTAAELLKRHT